MPPEDSGMRQFGLNVMPVLVCYLCVCLIICPGLYISTKGWGAQGAEEGAERSTEIRAVVNSLFNDGKLEALFSYLNDVEALFGDLSIDRDLPSLYAYRAVAFYNSLQLKEAEIAFEQAVQYVPTDTRSWINLGEVRIQTFNINGGIDAFQKAYELGDFLALSHLLRAKGWANSWESFEKVAYDVEAAVRKCYNDSSKCDGVDSSSGFEYTYLPGYMQLIGHAMSPNARESDFNISSKEIATMWDYGRYEKKERKKSFLSKSKPKKEKPMQRLKVGIISADFGVHPVSSLIRGAIQHIDTDRIELYCFSVQSKVSWWGTNISETAEHFIFLPQMSTREAALEVSSHGIEILIDLNGHTQFSGLRVMTHRPAPLQLSFLGLPTSTGAAFIDYYIGDPVALPPEHSSHFTESLALMPPCYIANDYAQLQGSLLDIEGKYSIRAPRSAMETDVSLSSASIVFATLSNSQKVNPHTFHIWMNILRRFSGSKMVHLHHKGSDTALKHQRKIAQFFGVEPSKLTLAQQRAWIDHLKAKTSLDLILDTSAKNGHTTGLDGIWAGVPTLTFASGNHMSTRAGESILSALGSDLGLSFSAKDYEDSIYRLVASKKGGFDKVEHTSTSTSDSAPGPIPSSTRLQAWRNDIQPKRMSSPLYDTLLWANNFMRQLEALWEVSHYQSANKRRFQIVSGGEEKKTPTTGHQVFTTDSVYFPVGEVNGRNNSAIASYPTTSHSHSQEQEQGKKSAMKKEPNENIILDRNGRVDELPPLPADIFNGSYIFLNIGGFTHQEGWYNVNGQQVEIEFSEGTKFDMDVDVFRMMDDLQGFPDDSVSAIYASHILEHASYGNGHLTKTIDEWYRVLRPGGLLMISVPDLTTLFQLYLNPGITISEKWLLTKTIYGGQTDSFDYHQVGFDESILRNFLGENVKFCSVERLNSFNLFQDSSEIVMQGRKISLSIAAKKCFKESDSDEAKTFNIDHSGTPFKPQEFPHKELCNDCDKN